MVAKARISVLSLATSQLRNTETSDEGYYRVPFLPPGEYELTIEREGFKKVTRRGVMIQVDVPARLDIELTVGQVSESVEVIDTTPLLTSDNAAVGTVIEMKRIVELPLNGRNWRRLAHAIASVTEIIPQPRPVTQD